MSKGKKLLCQLKCAMIGSSVTININFSITEESDRFFPGKEVVQLGDSSRFSRYDP